MRKTLHFSNRLLSAILALSIIVSLFAGLTVSTSAEESTVATEIVYCGQTLNADTPYLITWQVSGEGMKIKAQADETLVSGEKVLAYFDAKSGTLTYKSGMELTLDTNSYEPDFGWNTYVNAVQLGEDGDFYGIKANGSLTVDLGGYNNFIYISWNTLFKNNLYGIYADGDVTIKGEGYLKVPATFAQNNDSVYGDANANSLYSYGIYATGDVNLNGGTVNIFSQMYQRWEVGSNANSVGIYAGGKINLDGTKLKFRYQESVGSGKVSPFSKSPMGIADYTKISVTKAGLDTDGALKSIGHAYVTESVNNNCFNYVPTVPVTGLSLDKENLVVNVNGTAKLTASVIPQDATNQTIIWTSSNPGVATVDNGVVTGITRGTTTITAKTEEGNFVKSCQVICMLPEGTILLIVDENEIIPTKAIEINEDGVVFVPMVETFRHLGVEMQETSPGVYTGFGNNGDIVVDTNKGTAEIDWVEIELPAPIYKSGGTTMVPAYLIEDAVKTTPAVFDPAAGTLTVASPDPNDEYHGSADVGELMKSLPAGTVVVNQTDLMGGWSSGEVTVTKNVSVTIDGEAKSALQLKSNSLEYGEIPGIGAMTWKIGLSGKQDITEGDVLVIHFKARATAVNETGGTAALRVMYERSTDWSKLGLKDFAVEYDVWNDYYLPMGARMMGYNPSAEWPASKSSISLCFGSLPQTIEIADFEVIYYGTDVTIDQLQPDYGSYYGIEDDALWRKEAFRRIEKYRKDNAFVTVVDQNGNPIEGANVTVKQTESDFIFGVEACHDELVNLDLNSTEGSSMNKALKSFNALVCGLEMKTDKQSKDNGRAGIEMANEALMRDMRLKGHTVLWDGALLDFLSSTGDYRDLSYEELYRGLSDYVVPNIYSLKGKTVQWDVLNEPHSSNYIRKTYNTTRFYTDIAKLVHQIDPDTKLFVNEAGTMGKDRGMHDRIPEFLQIVKQMQSEGAPIDGIGLQTHTDQYYYPQGLYRQLDECSELVDEVAVTEFDFFHEKMENAGKYVGDILTVAFSHPKCNTFIAWGYRTLNTDRDTGLFYDFYWNERPGKKIWEELVFNTFKTNLDLVTDAEGCADFRGFHGEYEITVSYDGKEATFDFGLLKDGENTIVITIGDKISADVSCGKYIDVPEKVDYDSMSEAEDAYRKEVGNIPYISLVLEKNLKGVLKSGTLVYNGGTLSSNTSYTSGSVWGSSKGLSAIATDESTGQGILYKNSASGTYDLSHMYSGTVYNEGNMEVSAIVKTDNSRTAGFAMALGYKTTSSTINLGYIKTSASGYYLETLSGAKINLKDNTDYNVIITLVETAYPRVYDIKYTVEENCKTVVDEITESQTNVNNFVGLKGISLDVTANGAENSAVLTLKQARVKFYTYNSPVTYQDANGQAEIFNDTLRHYNTSEIVSTTDERYLKGESWGTDSLTNITKYFNYKTSTDHLYSMRTIPAGERIIKKKIGVLNQGETVDVEFDFYMAAPLYWYDSNGHVDVRLENSDGSVSRSLVKEEYAKNDYGFRINVLGDASGTYQLTEKFTNGAANSLNKNNLHVKLTLTPNADGNYDAKMILTNEGGEQRVASISNFLTKEEFLALDVFVFAGETYATGLHYNEGVAGIKNVVITKTATLVMDGDAISLVEGDAVGIKFQNPTKKPFDAQLVLARYVDDRFSSIKIIDVVGRRDANGFLSINVDKEKPEENRFLLMLLDGDGNLKPLKKAENIIVSVN